jgi:folylpolyglutamate synthase/dihydrofolate synthase
MTELNSTPQGTNTTYKAAVEWITGLVPFGVRPGLERIALLMERLGNPHRRLKFIHVAGTNGKGSVCAYLTSVLVQGGYDVGTFTSPYITKFTNRFQYNGEDIPEETLAELAGMLKPHVEAIAATELGSPTMFEVSTALAILYFSKVCYPDYVVWETGLGGRLDVTNIVFPVLSVITNVGHDHMDRLGDTIEAVAREKAGIIKPGVPVVSAVGQPEAVEVLRRTAAERKSTLYLLGEQFGAATAESTDERQSFRFDGPFRSLDDLAVKLAGGHQRDNAAVAVMALEVLRQYNALVLDDADLRQGLLNASWPGRMELVSREPRILLDGAHNPEGAEALAEALTTLYRYDRLHMMIGMLENKNHEATLKHILPIVDTLIITEPQYRTGQNARELADTAERLRRQSPEGLPFELVVEPDWRLALDKLHRLTGTADLGVAAGSLYLIADVRSRILYDSESEKGW